MGRRHASPADREYGWTSDRTALAVLRASYIVDISKEIPKRDRSKAGRPNEHPDHVYILAMALIGVFGAERPAAAWIRERTNWFKIRSHSRRYWDTEVGHDPPARSTINYNLKRLSAFSDLIRERFAILAVEQAQQQGCLNEKVGTMNKPPRANVVAADGTVPKSRLRSKTSDRLEAEGKLCRPVPKYKEGGDDGHWVSGFKELVLVVRPDDHPNSRVILGAFPVPKEGYGGEAGIAVAELEKLRKKTKGFLGLRYDGAFTGVHIDAMQKAGVSVISPVPKSDRRRLFGEVKCSGKHVHTLHTQGGDFVELELLDTGEEHAMPCKRLEQFSRRNADGTYRWYAKLELACGNHHTERLDITDADKKRDYNRTQVVRMHPPATDEYKNTYGWRQDVESVNNNLDTTLYRHRMVADTVEKQALVMIGFAIARNAVSAKVFAERVRTGVLSGPPPAELQNLSAA